MEVCAAGGCGFAVSGAARGMDLGCRESPGRGARRQAWDPGLSGPLTCPVGRTGGSECPTVTSRCWQSGIAAGGVRGGPVRSCFQLLWAPAFRGSWLCPRVTLASCFCSHICSSGRPFCVPLMKTLRLCWVQSPCPRPWSAGATQALQGLGNSPGLRPPSSGTPKVSPDPVQCHLRTNIRKTDLDQ